MVSKAAHLDIGEVLDRLANHGIVLPKRVEVESYLVRHLDLAELLDEMCTKVSEAFGPPAELSLEIYDDPEIDDHYLTLYVRQADYPPDIIDHIDAVCINFHRRLEGSSGYFLVTTDFRRPRGMNGV